MREVETTFLIPSYSRSFFASARCAMCIPSSHIDNWTQRTFSNPRLISRLSGNFTNLLHLWLTGFSLTNYSLYLLKVQAHNQVKQLQHRDIKPHNVLLTKDYSPVLMDFGSAAPARITPANLKEAAYLQASNHHCFHFKVFHFYRTRLQSAAP